MIEREDVTSPKESDIDPALYDMARTRGQFINRLELKRPQAPACRALESSALRTYIPPATPHSHRYGAPPSRQATPTSVPQTGPFDPPFPGFGSERVPVRGLPAEAVQHYYDQVFTRALREESEWLEVRRKQEAYNVGRAEVEKVRPSPPPPHIAPPVPDHVDETIARSGIRTSNIFGRPLCTLLVGGDKYRH